MYGRKYPRIHQHTPGEMNRMEKAFAGELDLWKIAGEIQEYQFESVKLKLAKGCYYTPDFLVVKDHIYFYEVKGFMRDDAAVKLKIAARLFPWAQFILVTQDGSGWKFQSIDIN